MYSVVVAICCITITISVIIFLDLINDSYKIIIYAGLSFMRVYLEFFFLEVSSRIILLLYRDWGEMRIEDVLL